MSSNCLLSSVTLGLLFMPVTTFAYDVKVKNECDTRVIFRSIGEDASWRIVVNARTEVRDKDHIGGDRVIAIWASDGTLLDTVTIHINRNDTIRIRMDEEMKP